MRLTVTVTADNNPDDTNNSYTFDVLTAQPPGYELTSYVRFRLGQEAGKAISEYVSNAGHRAEIQRLVDDLKCEWGSWYSYTADFGGPTYAA